MERSRGRTWRTGGLLVASLLAGPTAASSAQTDYYDLDRDRPLRVEDAYTAERYAFELQTAPLTLAQLRDGTLLYSPAVELEYGLWPGLEVGVGTHLAARRDDATTWRAGDVELSGLLNLTVETQWLPALGVRLGTRLPLDDDERRGAAFEATGIATRSVGGGFRLHLNGGGAFGDGADERWWAGAALDYALPFHHLLLLAETYVAEPESGQRVLHSTAGLRYQLSPDVTLDAGAGRSWRGDLARDWLLTLGISREFGVRGLMPRRPAPSAAAPAASPPISAPTPPAPQQTTRGGPGPFQRVYHPFRLPAEHNWAFRRQFQAVDRLFNAFDFGHGILYETLLTQRDAPTSLLEEEVYQRLVHQILPDPPELPMPEASFMPAYARLAPLAREMFEWAHLLHRQVYDILTAVPAAERDAAIAELLDYYLADDLAFTVVPKAMAIMDEQYFSMAFRERYPKFNGLIWAYHWLQLAAYEPLLLYEDPERRQAAMSATVARFWEMLQDPPASLPAHMPMAPAVAPELTRRYPRLAAIFDNLHMMHDVISDALVSDRVTDRGATIYEFAHRFRDPGDSAVSYEAWIREARSHGVDAQGGAVPRAPEPAAPGPDHPGH